MAYIEDFLLQGSQEENLSKNSWYLDTGASSHMTSKRSFFYSLDETLQGSIKFGDESSVRYEGK